MSCRVSVIIPVYNCEMYLPACIGALRAQTLPDMEFIFVNDASPDGSLPILKAAAEEDERIRVIDFSENRGVSAARNAGIEAARGEYIGFCDGDDWVEPDMFEALFEAAERTRADVTFCRVFKDRGSKREDVPLGFADGTVFDAETIRSELIPAMLSKPEDSDELPLSGYTPRNLFRRETIGDLRFREDIRYAEDLLFIVSCLMRARRAAAVDRAYYHYRINTASVTKHYSAHFLTSCEKSDDALEALLRDLPECVRRIGIRRRKMAVNAVRNVCREGTPYGFLARVREAKRFMDREDVRSWFAGIRPARFGLRLGLRMALIKYRLPLTACLLFSTLFRRA